MNGKGCQHATIVPNKRLHLKKREIKFGIEKKRLYLCNPIGEWRHTNHLRG